MSKETIKNFFTTVILVVLFSSNAIFSQTTQTGYVREYNEKAQKTPLSGVELNVRSANSTVSDNQGAFALNFLTLKPGEKINVRRIEKLGYEVFNKEAIEQWNLNPNTPFLIVMCKSDRFKKIRDNYERVSSESYARQLKKDEAELAKLKSDGKIKDEEFQKQLFELRENYEKQLDNLNSYVDRFSRIDLSELSNTEQQIIELVQQGKIDEAISEYEEQNFVDKYIKDIRELNEVSNAIDNLTEIKSSKIQSKDSILGVIKRQVGTLKLAGGKENFRKAGVILHDVAITDTSNYENLFDYANFLRDQHEVDSALTIFKKLENCNDGNYQVLAKYSIGEILSYQGNYIEARKYFIPIAKIELLKSDYKEYLNESLISIIAAQALAVSYSQENDLQTALEILELIVKAYENEDIGHDRGYVLVLNCLGQVYDKLLDANNAIIAYNKALSLFEEKNNDEQLWSHAMYNLASLYIAMGKMDDAYNMANKNVEILEKYNDKNPMGYGMELASGYNLLALTCSQSNENYANSYFDKAISCLDYVKQNGGYVPFNEYMAVYLNHASFVPDSERSIQILENAVQLCNDAKTSYNTYEIDNCLINIYGNLLVHSVKKEDLVLCGKYLELSESTLDSFNPIGVDDILSSARSYLNIGEICRTILGQSNDARKYYHKSIDIYKSLIDRDARYTKYMALPYYCMSASYMLDGDIDSALSHIELAIESDSNDIKYVDGKGEILVNAGRIDDANALLEHIRETRKDVDISTLFFYGLLNQQPETQKDNI